MKSERQISGGDSHAQKETAHTPEGEGRQQIEQPHFSRIAFLEGIAREYPGNSAEAQRERIFTAMADGDPLTTVEARRWLDCPHPAQRVLELRAMGADILTHWTTAETEAGNLHRFARYVLIAQGRAAS